MATVQDKSFNNPTDRTYLNPSRTNAGEPNGVLTPAFAGEIILDTTNNVLWKSITAANNSWVTLGAPF